jgi:hypothetical protein
MNAAAARFNPQNLPHDALRLANVFVGFGKGKAGGGRKSRERQSDRCKNLGSAAHTRILVWCLPIPVPPEKKCRVEFPKKDKWASDGLCRPWFQIAYRKAFTAAVSSSLTSKTV